MFNQGIQRQQNTQQGFNRAFNTFQTSDAMQTSDNNRARSNTDFQQRLDGDASNRRGGRGTARRGRGTNRGMNRGANRGANRGTGRGRGMVSQSPSRESNALDRALDEAISGSRPPRRKPRPNQPSTSNVGTSLDQALSEFESQKGGYKKQPYIKQQTRLNPNAKPFISQQSSGPAFGGSFHNQGPKNNQFVNNSPFANASPERSTNAFGQQQGATPFKPLQASPFGTPQKSASPFLSQHSSKAPAFVSTPSAPAFNPTQQQLPFGGNVSQPSSAFGGAQQSAFGGNMAQSSSAFGGAQQQQQTPFGGAQKQQQAPFGGNAFGMTQPQQQQRSPFGGNASQSSSAFGRPQQKPMMERKHTTKRDFIEDMPIDEFETAPTRKKQHTGAFSKQAGHFAQKQVKQGSPFEQPKEGSNMGAFSKKDLNPQVASFKPPKQSPLASVGNKEKNQKPPSSMTSRPKNNQTMMVALQSKTTTAADRAIRFGSTEKTNLYDAMKQSRIVERRKAIMDGLIPDPDAPTRLEEAVDFKGTCEDMCPEFEMLERDIQNNIDAMELNEDGEMDVSKMVKAYRRSAAGNEQPLPSDVLSADALSRTMDYLVDQVLTNHDLETCHGFIRDRTRSIRQDFTRQNIRDIRAIQVFEKIARFHIMCLHEMCEVDESRFSHQQEMEQLRKVLISLIEFYDDLRLDGIQTENESEFRGYHIIAHFRDQDVVRQTMTLPLKLFKHPQIQLALKFHSLAQRSNEIMETASRRNKPINVPAAQNFYTEFFKLVAKPETPFLMACLLESHFADVRKGALKAMNISYVYKLSGVPASYIERILCYDSLRQLMDEAHLYGLVVDESLDEPTFRFGQKHFKTKQSVFREPLTNPPQRRSAKLVEPKKYSMLFKDIINGVEGTDIKQDLVMPAESTSMADASTKQYGILDNRAEQLKTAKAAADAAEAAARMERQKMEALMNEKKAQKEAAMKAEREKKEKMEAERAAAVQKAHQEREERAKREKARLEQLRLEEERKLIAQQRELEALKRREEEERKRRLLDKDVIGQEMYVDLMSKFIEDAAKEFVLVQMMKQKTIMNFIRRKTIPWLSRSRQNIEARNEAIAKRGETLRWSKMLHNNNPYSGFKIENLYKTRLLRTPEMITERTTWALDLDESAKEMNVYKDDEELHANVWRKEFFNGFAHNSIKRDIYQPQVKGKHAWTHLISCDPTATNSIEWFSHKFDLDKEFRRNISPFDEVDVTAKLVDSVDQLYPKLNNEVEAITFVLPEKRTENEIHDAAFWQSQRERLAELIEALSQHRPDFQCPLLITYYSDDISDVYTTFNNIPELLDFKEQKAITDYHVLLMRKESITTRINEEMFWLFDASVECCN